MTEKHFHERERGMKDEQVVAISAILKSISHPTRLKIVCLLREREMSVGDIRKLTETTNSNASRHLSILRHQGIVERRKDANIVYNRIADRRMLDMILAIQKVFCPDFPQPRRTMPCDRPD